MRFLFVTLTRHDEPLGIMYLSSVLKNKGHEVRGVMSEKEDVAGIIGKFNPDVVGYSAMSCERTRIINLNAALKKQYSFFSIIGGPLATFSPEIIDEDGVDAVCRGESEDAVAELADAMEKKNDITKIKNIWVKVDGKIFKNEVRPFIKDLDSMPFPDRTIFKDFKEDMACNIIASRGCPFNCTYCHNTKYKEMYKGKGAIVRCRSVDNLIQEMKEILKKFDRSIFLFQEDHFYPNINDLKEFAAKYIEQVNIPFTVSMRPEFVVNEEVVRILKSANCKSVFTGCEAGNDRIRQKILNRKITKKQLTDTCDLLNKYGINIILQNMIGNPTSDFNDDLETLELNIRCKPYYAWASISTPFPGTELFQIAEKAGLISENYIKNFNETYHLKTSLKLPHADKINILHKIFALTVEYPELLKVVKNESFYRDANEDRIRNLKTVFDVFKRYKYENMYEQNPKEPDVIPKFVNELLRQWA